MAAAGGHGRQHRRQRLVVRRRLLHALVPLPHRLPLQGADALCAPPALGAAAAALRAAGRGAGGARARQRRAARARRRPVGHPARRARRRRAARGAAEPSGSFRGAPRAAGRPGAAGARLVLRRVCWRAQPRSQHRLARGHDGAPAALRGHRRRSGGRRRRRRRRRRSRRARRPRRLHLGGGRRGAPARRRPVGARLDRHAETHPRYLEPAPRPRRRRGVRGAGVRLARRPLPGQRRRRRRLRRRLHGRRAADGEPEVRAAWLPVGGPRRGAALVRPVVAHGRRRRNHPSEPSRDLPPREPEHAGRAASARRARAGLCPGRAATECG